MFTYFCSQELFDYECDSDLEWEEEEPGESLSSHSGVSAVVSVILLVSFCVLCRMRRSLETRTKRRTGSLCLTGTSRMVRGI